MLTADRISDEAGCVMHGGVLHAVNIRTTGAMQVGGAASGATVAGTTSLGGATVNATTTCNTVALNVTGTTILADGTVFDETADHMAAVLPVLRGGTTILRTTNADWAPTPAELSLTVGFAIVPNPDRTITLPDAAAIVTAFPHIRVGDMFAAPVGGDFTAGDLIFAAGAGGAIPAGTPDRFAIVVAGGWVQVTMTNVGAGTEAYTLRVSGV